jgi:UDP-N-acetylglucosamine--N-acetylmuramyl-(pentapeptide) pyrophosphoryl-undecaprenol N-acetylglucosamine transferase
LASRAIKIAVGFPVENYSSWPTHKLVYTGNLTSPSISKPSQKQGVAHFGFDSSLPVILVTGGSQGAQQINNLVLKILPQLLANFQIIHITGESDYQKITEHRDELDPKMRHRYIVRSFLLDDIGLAYAAAGLVIGRAGAGTISDAAALGKPLILIPNATMAGHQLHNARLLAESGAAKVLFPEGISAQALLSSILAIMDSPASQYELGQAIKKFGLPGGAESLADLILDVARSGRR